MTENRKYALYEIGAMRYNEDGGIIMNADRVHLAGFLHFRSDLGNGLRTGVVFGNCREKCSGLCMPCGIVPPRGDEWGPPDPVSPTPEELADFLKKEAKLLPGKKLGITFLGMEPMRTPVFLSQTAHLLKIAGLDLQIRTCGYGEQNDFDRLFGNCSLFSVLLPAVSAKGNFRIRRFPAENAIRNIRYLDGTCFPYELRIPVLTENTDEAFEIALFCSLLKNPKKISVFVPDPDFNEQVLQNFLLPFRWAELSFELVRRKRVSY